jgi:hypothetical protein
MVGGKMKYVQTSLESEVFRLNEDAVAEANRCAGSFVAVQNIFLSPEIALENARALHRLIFDAFIYGVDYGRKNSERLDDLQAHLTKARDLLTHALAYGEVPLKGEAEKWLAEVSEL